MEYSWAQQAIEIKNAFDALIIPLIKSNKPAAKINRDKWRSNVDYDPNINEPTDDDDKIIKWAKTFPGYGVIPQKNFFIVDVDVKEGQNGKASLKFLIENGLKADTFAVKSPSGGIHLYYNTPLHYTPKANSGIRVIFDDPDVQEQWDLMQDGQESSGIDTKYGWSYVAGPGSSFRDKGEYTLMQNKPLLDPPINMKIGFRDIKNIAESKSAKVVDPYNKIVDKNRNNDLRDYTWNLSLKRLSDSEAKLLIKEKIKWYSDEDNPPTFDEGWDMYKRAHDKSSDILKNMLGRYIYLIRSAKLYDTVTHITSSVQDLMVAHSNNMIPIETDKGTKHLNPVREFMAHIDRPSVEDMIFNPSFEEGIVSLVDEKEVKRDYYNVFINCANVESSPPTPIGELIYWACKEVFKNVFTNRKDRDLFYAYISTMLFEPGFRPTWGFHVYSRVRGCGKDTMANIVTELYGNSNVKRLDTSIFTDQFNSDLFTCGLGIFSDFSPVSTSKFDHVNASLKNILGSGVFRRRAMHQEAYQCPLNLRMLFLSNDGMDLPVDQGDRRIYKCRSDGEKLNKVIAKLANIFVDYNRKPEEYFTKIFDGPLKVTDEALKNRLKENCSFEQDMINVNAVTKDDVLYAKTCLYQYFKSFDTRIITDNPDCPENEEKEEYQELSKVGYIASTQSAIEHKYFSFKCDIVTESTLIEYLTDTKIGNVNMKRAIKTLEDYDIIKPVRYDTGRLRKITAPMARYDKDIDRMLSIGSKTQVKCWSVRNHKKWQEEDSHAVANEFKRIFLFKNLVRSPEVNDLYVVT